MFDIDNGEVQFAISAVKEAGRLARQVQLEMVEPALTKSDKSPVTVADFAAQAVVGCLLEKSLPGAVLVGEEGSAALRQDEAATLLKSVCAFVGRVAAYTTPETVCAWIDVGAESPGKRFWTLDPIDGTKGFLRGDQYAVALALIDDGEVKIGVLGCPNLVEARRLEVGGEGSIIVAVRGEGTWTAPLMSDGAFKRLRVSDRNQPRDARLLRSFESGHTNTGQMDSLRQALGTEAEPILMDSQAKYGVLAAGEGDVLLRLLSPKQPDYREMIWDQAAGSIVIEEAGGRITDLSGKALDFTAGRTLANNRGILATNGHLHDAMLEAVKGL